MTYHFTHAFIYQIIHPKTNSTYISFIENNRITALHSFLSSVGRTQLFLVPKVVNNHTERASIYNTHTHTPHTHKERERSQLKKGKDDDEMHAKADTYKHQLTYMYIVLRLLFLRYITSACHYTPPSSLAHSFK